MGFLKNKTTRVKGYTKTDDVEKRMDFKSWRKFLTRKYRGVGDTKAVDLGRLNCRIEISENEEQKILFAAGKNDMYGSKIEQAQKVLVKDSIVRIYNVGGIKYKKKRKGAKRNK